MGGGLGTGSLEKLEKVRVWFLLSVVGGNKVDLQDRVPFLTYLL